MTTEALTKDLIADTSLWRLTVRIDSAGADCTLRALLMGPESVERSVISHVEHPADCSVKAIENAVYDNPLLLGDFASVNVIFSGSDLFAVPAAASALSDEMAEAMLPDYSELRKVESERITGTDLALTYAVPADVFNFAARTFAAARFHHSLAIDAAYLFHRNMQAGASAHVFALCEPGGELLMVAVDSVGRLCHMSRKAARSATDCAYHILSCDCRGPVSVGGAPALRNEVCALLRRMRPDATVLPLTLPEDLLHIKRLAPEATFDMIFLTQL